MFKRLVVLVLTLRDSV